MLRQVVRQTRLVAPRRLYASSSSSSSSSTPVADTTNNIPGPRNVSDITQSPPEKQAPNRNDTWAPSQRPRQDAMSGVRFEQRDLDRQPQPYAAINLIAQQPIRYLHSNTAVCDGGRGAQGHPKIYINLDKPGCHACQYCGLRYAQETYKAELEALEAKKVQN